ncbi:hypothetical protein [Sphingomonas sp. Y38-1Y]|uniref:hypothetical protein n=1 Tax=Sphingomonas sp. Y38-1Y TaxID=3078265 RepID=UPI0028E9A767|nr:hypothetical protein [Sphingomonas sp. Y38-1Y]
MIATDQEGWVEASKLKHQHGSSAVAYAAAEVQKHAEVGDAAGTRRWINIELCLAILINEADAPPDQ